MDDEFLLDDLVPFKKYYYLYSASNAVPSKERVLTLTPSINNTGALTASIEINEPIRAKEKITITISSPHFAIVTSNNEGKPALPIHQLP
jgi:hypothetical protein